MTMIGAIGTLDQLLPGRIPAAPADAGPVAGAAGLATPTAFSDMLAESAGRTVGALDAAERLSIQALRGEADTRAVVDAVISAEQSLQAAIAIRDKIVAAYLEISRMAI